MQNPNEHETFDSEVDYIQADLAQIQKPDILKFDPESNRQEDGRNSENRTSQTGRNSNRERSDATKKTGNNNRNLALEDSFGQKKEDAYDLRDVISDDSEMYGTIKSAASSWTMRSVWTMGTVGSKFTLASDQSMGIDTVMKGDDVHYVTQRFGFASIIIALIQLLFLTIAISMCGFAPFNVNASFGPYPDALSMIGAVNSYELTANHQYWRFITASFITSGIVHMLLNVLVLLEAAAFLEREWGTVKWLMIYFFSAIGSVSFSCALDADDISVASSGAIMGLFGAKMSEFLMLMNFRTKKTMSDEYYTKQIILMLIVSAFVCIFTLFPFVSWAGHFGGFFCGFTIGMILFSRKIKSSGDRNLWVGSGLVLTALLLMTIVSMIVEANPREELGDVCNYYEEVHLEGYDCYCLF